MQKRFIEAGLLLVFPFLFLGYAAPLWRVDWANRKFTIKKSEYLAAIAADTSPGPRFHVFYVPEESHGFLSSYKDVVIVYDETDEVGKNPGLRSLEWMARRERLRDDGGWFKAGGWPEMETCSLSMIALGEHFYHVTKSC